MPPAWKSRGRRGARRGQRASAPEVALVAPEKPRAATEPHPRQSLSARSVEPSTASEPSTSPQTKLAAGTRVGRKFSVGVKLRSGAFGDIHMGHNVETGEQVAIKLEQQSAKRPQLPGEVRTYQALGNMEGFPRIHGYGAENGCNVLVMDLLGPSLEDLLAFCGKSFSLKTVFMVGHQAIRRVEQLHQRGFVHRDIKPDNLVVGLGRQADVVHLLDLGLARRYRDPETQEHLPPTSHGGVAGTPNFAGVKAHLGIGRSRRNDLESLGYMLVYFIRGRLPWQSIRVARREDWSKVLESKILTPLEVLCEDCPREIGDYLAYCQGLRCEQEPDYSYLSGLMLSGLEVRGWAYDCVFDWTLACTKKDLQDATDEREAPAEKRSAAAAPGKEARTAVPTMDHDSSSS